MHVRSKSQGPPVGKHAARYKPTSFTESKRAGPINTRNGSSPTINDTPSLDEMHTKPELHVSTGSTSVGSPTAALSPIRRSCVSEEYSLLMSVQPVARFATQNKIFIPRLDFSKVTDDQQIRSIQKQEISRDENSSVLHIIHQRISIMLDHMHASLDECLESPSQRPDALQV